MEHLDRIIAAVIGGVMLAGGLYYLYRTFRFSSRCPHCGERQPHRVPRKGLMRYTPTVAYFCCGRWFYQITNRKGL